jgi:ribosomal protein L29
MAMIKVLLQTRSLGISLQLDSATGNMQEPERKRQIKRQIIDVLFTE